MRGPDRVSPRQSDDIPIAEAHAVEHVAEVLRALHGVGEAAVRWAPGAVAGVGAPELRWCVRLIFPFHFSLQVGFKVSAIFSLTKTPILKSLKPPLM